MKAIRLHGRGGPDHLIYEDAPQPRPGPGEVLVRVAATAVIVNELKWDITYQTAAGVPRPLPIPGHDLSGVVVAVGSGVTAGAVGDAVYALLAFGRDGAEAEYAIALPDELAPKPRTQDDVHAAAIPLASLTAWQALFTHAALSSGQTVLIHGAAGGVGTYAVRLARWAGARVLATSSAHNATFLRELGASEIIDYTTTRFEDVVVVEPSGEQLRQISALVDAGQLRPIIDQVFPLPEARHAYEAGATGHRHGKIVLTIGERSPAT